MRPLAVLLAVPAGAVEIVKGPWLQDVRLHSAVVMWETDVAAPGEVELAGPGGARTVAGPPARLHELRLAGLAPSAEHRYRVRSGGAQSPWATFRTARRPGEAFTFVVYGDSRSGHEAHADVLERIAAERADFVLQTGDLVADGGDERAWQRFFDAARELLRERPLFPALGNHELASLGGGDRYRAYFSLPDDAPDPEDYYAFTWANSRFLVLDSNILFYALSPETAWLEAELAQAAADPAIRHVFAILHHGPYATGPHGGNLGARLAWAPLFARYGVDAVFSGHDHTYERLAQDGVRYLVTGGGGAPPYPQDVEPDPEDALASLRYEATHHHVRVEVRGADVAMTAVRPDGSVIEEVRFRAPARRVPLAAAPPPAAPAAAPPTVRAAFPPWLLGAAVLALAGAAALVVGRRR